MSYAKHGSKGISLLRSFRVNPGVTSEAISAFLQSLDCPRSLAVEILFRNGEFSQLANLECNPSEYENAHLFRDAYAATKFLSKYKGLKSPGLDLDRVAKEKFEKFETLCKRTNARFRNLGKVDSFFGPTVQLHLAVQRKIQKILGDFSFEELVEVSSWGPGASTTIKSRDASASNKFLCETGITRDLYALLFPEGSWSIFEGSYPLWASHLRSVGSFPNFQVGNKVVTVPKDATTNRVIAIEPGINIWFQLGIGKILRRRLSRFGLDLRYQERNQHLAYLSSISGLNATVDFSSASDSISLELVRELLPPRWFSLMDSCRSHFGQVDGSSKKWEKFSSMGNGFTFELETLIFYATALCCAEYLDISLHDSGECVSAYGDDVIIPCRCLPLFSTMAEFYGFLINPKKTHHLFQFRESCGAHYHSGIDVKPIYLKDILSSVQTVYRFANNIRRLAHRFLSKEACDVRFKNVFDDLVSRVPKSLRFRVSEGLGDGGFIHNFDESTPSRARHGYEGYYVTCVIDTAIMREDDSVGLLLARLWSSSTKEMRNSVPLRGRTRSRLHRRFLVRQWYDLGPWL